MFSINQMNSENITQFLIEEKKIVHEIFPRAVRKNTK